MVGKMTRDDNQRGEGRGGGQQKKMKSSAAVQSLMIINLLSIIE